jgi:hypothetical protein
MPSKQEIREAMRKKQEQDMKNRDFGGMGGDWLNTSKYGDVQFFSPKPKKVYKLDIIPFVIKTKNNPAGLKPGYQDYVLDVWVHRKIGAGKKDFLCLAKTYGRPCPICEEMEIQLKGGVEKEDLAEGLKPSRRVVYNVIDLKEEDKGIQLFSVSQWLFGKELLEKIEFKQQDTGEKIFIADLEEGYTVSFRTVGKEGKYKGVEFKDFDLIKRDDAYDDEIINDAYSLDEMLVIPTYEEIKKVFLATDDEEEEEEEEVSPKKSFKKKKMQEDDLAEDSIEKDEEDEEEETPPPKKKVGKKAVKKEIEPQEMEEEEDDSPVDDEEEEEEEEEPDPPKKNKSKNVSSKKETSSKKDKCPSGHKFGVDTDKKKECAKCKVWEACADEFEKQ